MFSILINIIKKIQIRKVRKIMRGYKLLKNRGELELIGSIKRDLTENILKIENNFSKTIIGEGFSSGELIVRQYLLMRLCGLSLNCALLLSLIDGKSSLVYPIPAQWRVIVEKYNIKVANVRSEILWKIFIFIHLIYGVYKIIENLIIKNNDKNSNIYSYFHNLELGNTPTIINNIQSHDVISWYIKKYTADKNITEIIHNVNTSKTIIISGVKVKSQNQILPAISISNKFSYLLWGIKAIVISVIDYSCGYWCNVLLLNQAPLAKRAQLAKDKTLAIEYMFHNTGFLYRPLWTYEVEKKGSNVNMYFYSTNCEFFKNQNKYLPIPYGWKAMNWNRYIVWDEYQADFVRRAVGVVPSVDVVGPIWFVSNAEQLEVSIDTQVGVFDVAPYRNSRYFQLVDEIDYYIPSNAIKFLDNISEVVRNNGLNMLWKSKKGNIKKYTHPKYLKYTKELLNEKHVKLINSEISISRIVEACAVVISMPYTSTALIAKGMGIPSIYYDPTRTLQQNDRASHGIPLICGLDHLKEWFSTQSFKKIV